MTEIRIWAPKANQLDLESHGQRMPMEKVGEGWWTLNDPLVKHGIDYAFYVNKDGPFPNPSSQYQPEGVHGPSRWVDHSLFTWTDADWRQPPQNLAVFYELHIGTFTPEGTYKAVIEHLDYLVDLGITHVEIMPVAEFSGKKGWGYDGVAIYAPHHAYGTPEDLKTLVDACHQRGLAIILDVVYNHLGPVGNYLGIFGYYFTNKHSTPWGEAINMDGANSDEVRRFFINNAIMWLRDYHFDGLRIDAVHAIIDTSAIHFLEQLSSEVRKLESEIQRPLILIAESDLNDCRIIRPVEAGGYGIDAQWNEDFHHALHAGLTNEHERYYQDFGKLADLAKVLTKGLVYDGCYSVHRRRTYGRLAIGIPGHQFVGYFQNHDQIGNRALGERTSHLLSPEKIKMGAALVFTAPFLPMLFQGEEWGASNPFLYFTDHQTPELGEAVYERRKREFSDFVKVADKIPHPQADETYTQSKLHWDELKQNPHAQILDWHRALINLRRQLPDLRDSKMENTSVDFDEEQRWLIMKRGSVVVACNFADSAQTISTSDFADRKSLLYSNEGIRADKNGISLPANTVAIFGNHDVEILTFKGCLFA